MHKYIITMIRHNLNVIHACRYTCVPAHLLRVKHKIWYAHVHTLLHKTFACPRLPVCTRDTRVEHITTLHLVCCTACVVHRYSTYVCIENEMYKFCSWGASNSILQMKKYMGVI